MSLDIYNHFFLKYCVSNNIEKVKEYLNNTLFDLDVNNVEPLVIALENNYTELAKILLKDGRINPGLDNNICFDYAVIQSNVEILELLLQDDRVDKYHNNDYPFRKVLYDRNYGVMELFLKYDVELRDYFIIISSNINDIEMVKILLDSGKINPCVHDCEVIKTCVRFENTELLKLFLKNETVFKNIFKLDKRIFDKIKKYIASEIKEFNNEEIEKLYNLL